MSTIAELRYQLKAQPSGPLEGKLRDGVVATLLAGAWDECTGVTDTEMKTWKIERQEGAQRFEWNPPYLSFTIERHGGIVLGSKYAEIQQWSIDLETGEARPQIVGHRQIFPRDPPFNEDEKAEQICKTVTEGFSATPCLEGAVSWRGNDEVLITLSKIVPPGVKQTTEVRQKRLRQSLVSKMSSLGWILRYPSGRLCFIREPRR